MVTMSNSRKINMLVIHCSWTPPEMDIGTSTIRRWHRANGWLDIGYHYVIKRDGTVENGRPAHQQGAHARGYNRHSLGICLIGGKGADGNDERNFTEAQYKSLRELIARLKDEHPIEDIVGHCDLDDNKTCPTFDVGAWLSQGKDTDNDSDNESA